MSVQRLNSISAAGGVEPATRRQQRGDGALVDADRCDESTGGDAHEGLTATLEGAGATGEVFGRSIPQRLSAASRSAPSSRKDRPAATGCARTTSRVPGANKGSRSATRCWRRRRTWLRTIAPPTPRPTTKPARGEESVVAAGSLYTWTTRSGRPLRRPRRTASANSGRRRSREATGSTRTPLLPGASGRQFGATLAAPCREDRPACAGAHAQPEPVRLRTTAVVRLKGALAHSGAPGMQVCGRRPGFWPQPTPSRPTYGTGRAQRGQTTRSQAAATTLQVVAPEP